MTRKEFLTVSVFLGCLTCGATTFDVRSYGAKGDGVMKDTVAVQKAVDAAEAAGGGEVLLSAGTYLCGTVYLKDNVDFHLAAGATLKGSPDREDYCAADFTPQNWASSRDGDNTSGGHLLVAVGRRHVTLRGPGKVDGNGAAFLLDRDGKQWPNWKKGIPWRPGQMVWICDSEDVRITDVELTGTPYWTCNLLNCERVWVRGCYIHNERKAYHTWNGDGLDIDRCRYVEVSDCRIDTTDDCITLRASSGKRLKEPKDCAFVTVANCNLSSNCNAIRLGVGEGRIHDATFSNLVISDTGFAINCVGAYVKGNRGTDITDIRFSNLRIAARQFLWMHHRHSTESVFSNIVFDGVSGTVEQPSLIDMNATTPAKGIRFVNVDVPLGVKVKNADVSFCGRSFPLRVLMIGNSFSASVLHTTPQVAESLGLKVDFVNCNIGGCTLKTHWENVEKAADPDFLPYLAMFGTPGSETAKSVRAVCKEDKTNIPQLLSAVKWDVVTIQQGSVGSAFADTYQPYADKLIATIRKYAPQAEILIQETWAYLPYHAKLDEWKMTQGEMYERLHAAYGELARRTGFRVIPTGTAVQTYRSRLPPFRKLSPEEWAAIRSPNLPDLCGDPCGVPKWRKPYRWEKGFDREKVQLMIDSTHLNSEGDYLQACVWLSVLFGIDARTIACVPAGLDPSRAALMRECVHAAVAVQVKSESVP